MSIRPYKGNSGLKRPNEQLQWDEDQIIEVARCRKDPIYFTEKYMKIVHVDRGLIPFEPYDYQKDMLAGMKKHRQNIFCMSRQSGKSVTVCAFILWYIIFNDAKEVGILANKGEIAREILGRIRMAYEHLPLWLKHGVEKWNEGSFKLENKSVVIAAATSSDAVRGHSFAMIYLDEAAFVENFDEFFQSVYPTISSGRTTKVIMTSTPNGLNHFYKFMEEAKNGKNNYNWMEVPWYRVPGRDEAWKAQTIGALGNDMQKFNQEFAVEFLGSSNTLIAGWKLKQLVARDPVMTSDGMVRMYEPPVPGHVYCAIADVSEGKGLDASALSVFDVTRMPYRQVMTFNDSYTTPGDFAAVIARIARQYNNAAVLTEVNNIGHLASQALFDDHEYENLLYTENAGRAGKRIVLYYSGPQTDRGIRTTKIVKQLGCSLLKLLVEGDQLLINDAITIGELSTFSRKNSSYEAEQGCHDDMVMTLVLFGWLTGQDYFKQMTDINTISKLRERSESQLDDEMLPLGFFEDGIDFNDTEDHNGFVVVRGWEWLND